MNLDQMSPSRAFDLFQSEDASIHEAIRREKTNILKCIRKVAASFKAGGRLLYVGAGTSGRLGVLDASECPPTFGVSPDRVVGVIAGGRRALWHAVEGAEDDSMAGWRAMQFHKVKKTDTVVDCGQWKDSLRVGCAFPCCFGASRACHALLQSLTQMDEGSSS